MLRALFLLLFYDLAFGQIRESDFRLPRDIDSIEYKLLLKPDLKNSYFSGKLSFIFKPLKSTEVLVLNTKDLNFVDGSVKILSRDGGEQDLEYVEEDKRFERLFVKPKIKFLKGELYEFCAEWTGIIYEEGNGLYSIDYLDEKNKSKRMLASQLRPVHARRVFPCLDEPSFRAHFKIRVIHDPKYKAISNMPVSSFTHLKSGNVLTEFEQSPPIPAFLIGLIVSELPEVEGKWGFYGMATPANFEGIKYSVEIGPKLAAAMETVTAISYPLNKTHQVALSKLVPVAMENWGLYNFREENILYVENESLTVQKQTAARFSGHEICHAWIGNMVSLGWWDYLWMSEMFAMYYEYLLPNMVDNCWRMEEQMVIDLHQSGLLSDSLPGQPLTTRVLTPDQISAKFSGITYTKGPAVLRMSIHILGQETYLKGLRKLVYEKAYNTLKDPETLWSYLSLYSKDLPADLSTIMSDWTVLPGYPVVNVATYEGEIWISQSKFSLDEDSKNMTWWIPLTYTTQSECDFVDTKPKLWFRPGKAMMKIKENVADGDWVIFNVQSTGFYRVNYDLYNWDLIIKQLKKSLTKIVPLNRAQLIDDSLNLARAGRLPYKVALSLGTYLSNEADFIPWRSAIRAFSFLQNALLNSGIEDKFKEYLCTLVAGAYEKIGWDEQKCEEHPTKVNREEIVRLACQTGHKPCLQNSIAYVISVINGRPKKISVDVKETALCYGIQAGKDEMWNSMRSLYESSGSLDHLKALTCTSNSRLVKRFLSDSLKNSDADGWNKEFAQFASRPANAQILLDLLNEKQSEIKQKITEASFTQHLNSIGQFLTTKKQLEIFENVSKTTTGVEERLNDLRKTISWRKRFLPQIESFFAKSENQFLFSD